MAEVWISNGNGDIVINDIPIIEYFPKQEDRFVDQLHNTYENPLLYCLKFVLNLRNQVWHPLITLDCMEKFDVECNVIGGGTTGKDYEI